MKLFVLTVCLAVALHATNGQNWGMAGGAAAKGAGALGQGTMSAQGGMAAQGSMAAQGGMAAQGSMATQGMGRGMIGSSGMMAAAEESSEMKQSPGMMSATMRGGRTEMGAAGMMRSSGMEAKKMDSGMMSSGMMRSGMSGMGSSRGVMEDSRMSMRKESGMMMSSKKAMGSDMMMAPKPKGMMAEPRLESAMPRKGLMRGEMETMDLEKLLILKKEEMRAHGILDEEMDVKPDGYMYKYKTEDGVDAFQQGTLAQSRSAEGASMMVEGGYSWTAPNGHIYKVEYRADENGYHPRITSRA